MARLRTMLVALAVAALLLVGTASAALAGITARGRRLSPANPPSPPEGDRPSGGALG